MATNYIKLVPHDWLGQFSAENSGTLLILSPIVPIAMWVDLKVHGHVGGTWFYRPRYGFLIVVGIKLIGDGLTSLALARQIFHTRLKPS